MTDQPMSFAERRRQFRAQKGLDPVEPTSQPTKPAAKSQPQVDPDLIPNVYDRSETDQQIDNVLDSVTILEAYNKWVGKKVDAATLSRDETMVSCPKPDHRDNDPSAWVNHSKGTWFCGGCQEGGDIYDIAAMYEPSIDTSTYKSGTEFHKLRERMFEAFGGHVRRGANFSETVWVDPGTKADEIIPEVEVNNVPDNVVDDSTELDRPKEAEKSSDEVVQPDETVAAVRLLHPTTDDDEGDLTIYPKLDLATLIRPNTFLDEYVKACGKDDVPVEYHFWNGMLALGHTAGRRVTLTDSPDVVANLMMVTLGRTGSGKSKARRYLVQLMKEVNPYQDHGTFTTGVKTPPPPGSGEHLIDQFCHVQEDPNTLSNPNTKAAASTPKVYTPVNGMVNIDEFSTIMKITGRPGNTLEPTILGMADANDEVSTGSRGSGDAIAFQPFCSISSSSQPQNLAGLITKEHASGGFLNRWIFITGEAKRKQVFGSASIDLSRAADSLKAVKKFCGTERRLTIDPTLQVEIEAWFESAVFTRQAKDSTFMLARLDLCMKKMLLLFSINAGETMISRDTFERIKPLLPYLINCFALVHQQVGVGKAFEMAEAIENTIITLAAKKKGPVTMREINHSLRRRKYAPDQVNKTIAELVKAERIEEVIPPSGSRGRAAVKFQGVGA